jgi:phosphate transport system substrate-binding protein
MLGGQMKKAIVIFIAILLLFVQVGCGNNDNENIHLISREAGSGTRDAFTELMGIKVDGKDNTALSSEITSSTFVVMNSVKGDKNAIGYVSLGTLKDTVKALSIDDVAPTSENIKNGSYPLRRVFNLVDNGNLSELASDFVEYIQSKQGLEIIEEEGYVPIVSPNTAEDYVIKEGLKGRIVIAGSTSVAPLMDLLADQYKTIYPDVEIEIQQTGSGAGITSALEGACDIGMSSRDLKESEKEKGAVETGIAFDGIVVVVNQDNSITNLGSEDVRQMFTGERITW